MAAVGNAILAACRRCLHVVSSMPEPPHSEETHKLLVELKVTPRHLEELFNTFLELKDHDPITTSAGPTEVSMQSLVQLVRLPEMRPWLAHVVNSLIMLGGLGNVVPWDSFLYILLNFCMMTKIELAQVMFYIIAKDMRSWTVQYLTSSQLQEFYDRYKDCPIASFNTSAIEFDSMALAKYSIVEFVQLVHQHSELINPCMYLQRQFQKTLPDTTFWDDVDRITKRNRQISLSFLRVAKCVSVEPLVLKLLNKMSSAEDEMQEKASKETFVVSGADGDLECCNGEFQRSGEYQKMPMYQNTTSSAILYCKFGLWRVDAAGETNRRPEYLAPQVQGVGGTEPPVGAWQHLAYSHRMVYVQRAKDKKIVDAGISRDELPLPSSVGQLAARKERPQTPVPAWVKAAQKQNEHPVTGQALGTAALKPPPKPAEIPAPDVQTVEEAKNFLRESAGRPKLMARDRDEQTGKEQSRKDLETALNRKDYVERAEELLFIQRSRKSYSKKASVVQVLDGTSKFELITRPEKKISSVDH